MDLVRLAPPQATEPHVGVKDETRMIKSTTCIALLVAGFVASSHAESLDRFLLAAARNGDTSNVVRALRLGADPNYLERVPVYGEDESPLFAATRAKSADCMKLLLDHGADPLLSTDQNPWKFALAAVNDFDRGFDVALFELLLSAVTKLPSEDDRITDWLVRPAVRHSGRETLQKIERLGVKIGAISKSGNTIITAAAEMGFYDEAEAWLAQYSEQLSQSTNRLIRMDDAVEFVASHPWEDKQLARLLDDARLLGLKPIDKDRFGTPLWKKASRYRLPFTATALGCPQDEAAKIVPRSAEELAIAAAWEPHSLSLFKNLVDQILSESKNPTETASRLFLEILAGVRKTNIGPLEHLLACGADVNAEGKTRLAPRHTPLQAAIAKRELDTAEWLVKHGADVNHLTAETKSTALEFASPRGGDLVNWLFAHGAVPQESQTGRSLIKIALNGPDPDALIQILLANGADPYSGEQTKSSSIDLLAERLDILRLRTLDTRQQYRELIETYTPPSDSRFIGIWWNKKGEFSTFSLILTPDGLAIVGTSIAPMGFFPWRTIDATHALIEVTDGQQRTELTVEWVSESNALRLTGQSEVPTDLLFKQPEKPLSATEYMAQQRAKAKELPEKSESKTAQRYKIEGTSNYSPTAKELVSSGTEIEVIDQRIDAMAELESLRLSDNRLQSLPESLRSMKKLREVRLDENWFRSLPPWFGELSALRNLWLSWNAFSDFPEVIRPLIKLEMLDISYNQLRYVPEWIGELSGLKFLGLSGNRLNALPDSCSALAALETIDLTNNNLASVPKCLLSLPKLRSVSLRGNPIEASDKKECIEKYPKCRDWF